MSAPTSYTVTFFEPMVAFPKFLGVNSVDSASTRFIGGKNLLSATLTWDLKIVPVYSTFKGVSVNGKIVSSAQKGSADVTPLVILGANNTVRIEYSRILLGGAIIGTVESGGVRMSVTASGVTQQEAQSPNKNSFKIPNWGYAVFVLIVLAFVAYFLFATPNGGKMTNLIVDGGRKLAKTITGEGK
jgi:hypothetical protein